MSRTKAVAQITQEDFEASMAGIVCDINVHLRDEAPAAYKDLTTVMANQVPPPHTHPFPWSDFPTQAFPPKSKYPLRYQSFPLPPTPFSMSLDGETARQRGVGCPRTGTTEGLRIF